MLNDYGLLFTWGHETLLLRHATSTTQPLAPSRSPQAQHFQPPQLFFDTFLQRQQKPDMT